MENNKKAFRWRYFIDKPFQLRFIARFSILIILGLGISLLVLGIANTQRFNTNVFFQAKNVTKDASGNYNLNYNDPFYKVVSPAPVNIFQLQMWPMIYVSILYIILIIVFGLFISHKMAGPIYRIKKTLDMATKGQIDIKTLEFKLRKKDELQDLVDSLNKFLDSIYGKKR